MFYLRAIFIEFCQLSLIAGFCFVSLVGLEISSCPHKCKLNQWQTWSPASVSRVCFYFEFWLASWNIYLCFRAAPSNAKLNQWRTWSPASVPRPFSHSLASRHIYLCSLLWYWGTSAKSVHRGHFPFTCRPQYSIIFFFIIIPWRFCSYSSTPENSLSHSRASEKRHHRGSPFRGKC